MNKLNHAIHIAAIAQIRYDTPGRSYYRHKLDEGKSRREALRCLKRRISDAVYRQLQLDRELDQHQDQTWPRWPSSRGGHPVLPVTRNTASQRATHEATNHPRLALVEVRGVAIPKHQHRGES